MNHRRRYLLAVATVVLLPTSALAFSTPISSRILSSRSHGHMVDSSSSPNYLQAASVSAVDSNSAPPVDNSKELGKAHSKLVKYGMYAYIASMCIALPVTLFPIEVLHRIRLISRLRRERLSLLMGTACARWMLRLFPFYKLTVNTSLKTIKQEPSVWVCNHQSMLDVFVMLAADKKMRGKNKRPIKIVYWKGLEDNPITKLLFRQSGFISVDMAPNKPGEENQYDRKSFKSLLKQTKQAFAEGFDIGLLPEGQLNPNATKGLLPVFSGAYTLAKMSRRPIQFMALWGTHYLWHPNDELAQATPKRRHVKIRVYPPTHHVLSSGEEFVETFTEIVGHFGKTGEDLDPEKLQKWLNGTEWKERTNLETENITVTET